MFRAPPRIPPRIAQIIDDLPAAPPGVPGGIVSATGPILGAAIGLLDQLARPAVPEPPRKVVRTEPSGPAKPLHVSAGVQSARLIRKVMPVYPEMAKHARISGTVSLVGVIGKDGTIQHLQAISGPPLLVKAAMDAVSQWIYRPTLLNNEPVEVIAPIEVVFTLSQ